MSKMRGALQLYTVRDELAKNVRSTLKAVAEMGYKAVQVSGMYDLSAEEWKSILDENGLAQRGLLVRHLVLPNGLAGTAAVMRFLAEQISQDTYVNIMDQYHPAYRAIDLPQLNRRASESEIRQANKMARAAGIHRLDRNRPLSWIED